ncbi:hypothetical protein ACET1M_23455 [Escherichia coli]
MDTTPEDIADPDSDFEEKLEEISEHDDEQVTGVDEPPAPPYTRLPIPMMSAHFKEAEEDPQVSRQRCSSGRYYCAACSVLRRRR